MAKPPASTPYVLGSSDPEHDRLLRQGRRLGRFTDRFFRDAGIGPGQRVLDLGSGVGDVALLVAQLVGPGGAVVGVDRDADALAKARHRAAEAGLAQVRFIEGDVTQLAGQGPFDVAVGRFVLMFQPDPVAVLRSVAAQVAPGGLLVFQEANWPAFLSQVAHLPLWSAAAGLIMESFRRSGVREDISLVLFRGFQEIGFGVPTMRLDVPIDQGADTRRWLSDLIATLEPRFRELGLSTQALGDLGTLGDRLERELDETRSYAAGIGIFGAWSRKPAR